MTHHSSLITHHSSLPAWSPDWARQLADLYFSGTTCLFVLHGNVRDLVRCPTRDGEAYVNLSEFLATQVFGTWDIVLQYDLGRGLRPLAGSDPQRLQSMMQYLGARLGEADSWPRDPDNVLLLLDKIIERNIVEPDGQKRKSISVILDYAQYLVPAGEAGGLARAQGTNLVRLLGWAQNPYIKRLNVAFCLVADKLTELNDRLVRNPHVAAIEIPLPDASVRELFASWVCETEKLSPSKDFTAKMLADQSSGLSLVSLNTVLSQSRYTGQGIDAVRFRDLKKAMIERQCQGLVEFVEPKHKLDLVVGQEVARKRLESDAELITRGRFESAPMGYLLCGAVGTGKTFLAECYAGTIGIPCLKLRNFRSKYVGETEGNLEQVLTVLRSLGPVVVIIDEADAALGNRSAEGDSGTSSRVFSMIASQMGDTRYRGRILWMLLTCRPDLLPIDLKRQGRAEVHIPMFYPRSESEIREMFVTMARKNKISLPPELVPPVKADRHLSGADIESIVLAAGRRAVSAGRDQPLAEDIQQAIDAFIPSAQGLEKELQELAAVLECTDMEFLPPDWRARVAEPDGRVKLQERMMAIRSLLDD